MIIIDITNTLTLLLLLALVVLTIFISHELKKSFIVAIPLFAFLALLVMHVIQLMTLSVQYDYNAATLTWCIVLDFAFIFMTFISYLWVDDLEAKKNNKKSIDNSLEWFWKEI
ncbi:MAG: hypothetical protein HFJ55_05235 [Clostridia bacterium]|jgi:hypothetical protein|nr:hypothetical protein [Clostridia bacterium]